MDSVMRAHIEEYINASQEQLDEIDKTIADLDATSRYCMDSCTLLRQDRQAIEGALKVLHQTLTDDPVASAGFNCADIALTIRGLRPHKAQGQQEGEW